MNEQEQQPTAAEATETSSATTAAAVSASKPATGGKRKLVAYVAATLLVLALLLGVLFVMEKEGRSETDVFSWLIEAQQASTLVATVNDVEIRGGDLATSIEQFTQVATAQGVDVTDPTVQNDIRSQALEVLINTELLKQAAAESGLAVSTEAAEERLTEITAGIGGDEALEERMVALGVTREKLLEDIREEILIGQYLDQLFATEEIVVSEEEVAAFYEQAGGEEAGLPALEDIREQIEQQIVSGEEQAMIDAELTELRAAAEIEVVE